MTKKHELGIGLTDDEKKRVKILLERFLRHVKLGKLVICGGLATRYHFASHGLLNLKRQFNDIDLLVEQVDDIAPSILSDFMLYHYHPPGKDDPIVEKNYFFYAFVDPETRMKTDVFPYRWSKPERFINVPFQGKSMPIVGIEDQLIQCLYDVSRISDKQKVDPKQLQDVHILMQIADFELAKKIWKQNNHPLYPKTFDEAVKRADKIKVEHPELWKVHPYRKPTPYKCPRCQDRPDFPITNMSIIYKVLGYIE